MNLATRFKNITLVVSTFILTSIIWFTLIYNHSNVLTKLLILLGVAIWIFLAFSINRSLGYGVIFIGGCLLFVLFLHPTYFLNSSTVIFINYLLLLIIAIFLISNAKTDLFDFWLFAIYMISFLFIFIPTFNGALFYALKNIGLSYKEDYGFKFYVWAIAVSGLWGRVWVKIFQSFLDILRLRIDTFWEITINILFGLDILLYIVSQHSGEYVGILFLLSIFFIFGFLTGLGVILFSFISWIISQVSFWGILKHIFYYIVHPKLINAGKLANTFHMIEYSVGSILKKNLEHKSKNHNYRNR